MIVRICLIEKESSGLSYRGPDEPYVSRLTMSKRFAPSTRRGPICSERRFRGGDDLYLIHIMMKGSSNEEVLLIINHFGERKGV